MKALTVLMLVGLIVSVSVMASSVLAYYEPSVGVKEGDSIEYNIIVTGTGTPPPTHDVRWMRIDILQVYGAVFSVNITARYANGTVGSEVWDFNFTAGNVGGWIIIPSNLSPGDTFYDFSIHNHNPVNVTIQGQEQKTVLGATRTVTHGNDSFRHKEWDMATGVFVGSSEVYRNVTNKDGWYIEDLTVTVQAVATNMWRPQIIEQNQAVIYGWISFLIVIAAILSLVIAVARRKKLRVHSLCSPFHRKIASFVLLTALVVTVGAIAVTPLSENQVPLSFREINLLIQTLWLSLLLVSMWFRKKGNFLVHGVLMVLVVTVTLVSFSGVLLMSPPNTASMGEYFGSPVDVAVFLAHGIFSIPAVAFGVWLVALWRFNSSTFPAKSNRAAHLTMVFWVLSYVVGVLDFVFIRANLLG